MLSTLLPTGDENDQDRILRRIRAAHVVDPENSAVPVERLSFVRVNDIVWIDAPRALKLVE